MIFLHKIIAITFFIKRRMILNNALYKIKMIKIFYFSVKTHFMISFYCKKYSFFNFVISKNNYSLNSYCNKPLSIFNPISINFSLLLPPILSPSILSIFLFL